MRKILWEWNDFLRTKGLLEEWDKAVYNSTDDTEEMEDFIYSLVGWRENPYWQPAEEYGERAWRIIGSKLSVIVWDDGNGWFTPMGVEIIVGKISYLKEGSLETIPNPSMRE